MRKLLGVAALAALVGLAGCVDEAVTPPGPEGVKLSAAERTACLAKGGSVAPGGMLGSEQCFVTTPDAGKSCQKASDCSGFCEAESRTCSKVTPQFGCFEFLDEQGQKLGLCVD